MRRFLTLLGALLCATMILAAPGTKVVGRLGQAIKDTTIHSSADSKSRVYWKVPAFQYLVINQSRSASWYAVVLVNGKSGFVRKDAVADLPYDVTVPTSNPAPSRGGASRSGTTRELISQAGNGAAGIVLQQSVKYVGTRYVWGGNSLKGGIDCSGFVKELFEKVGVNLPRTAREQAKHGKPITRLEDLQPGDRLYFWDKKRGYIGHTGIFMGYTNDGGAYFIHSSVNNRGVATDDLRNPKWRNMLVGARR